MPRWPVKTPISEAVNDAKQGEPVAIRLETGAPAALAWIGEREAAARQDYQLRHDELNTVIKRIHENLPKDDGADFDALLRTAERNLTFARENVETWQKSLRLFDKQIAPERREGEKVSVVEVKEMWAQLQLCIQLAVEQLIIADAQSVSLASSPEEFHQAHAANYRAAITGAIDAARRDNVIPAWIEV